MRAATNQIGAGKWRDDIAMSNTIQANRRRVLRTKLQRLRSIGIRDRPTSPRSPWQNGCAERLIGSIRRECLDHVVVFGERHLRHVLLSYLKYYNEVRT